MTSRATATLNSTSIVRLTKLCGMFGSDHEGERATAAALADRLVRQLGPTWCDIIIPQLPGPEPETTTWHEPKTFREAVGLAMQFLDSLTPWERKFILSIREQHHVSEKQAAILDQIVEKIRSVGPSQ